ncbi:MAG: DUF4041 domain-containing protein [Micrococcales bacterium]|nr:DUF4041 domain-containing protein [Micrococcales bacterium]
MSTAPPDDLQPKNRPLFGARAAARRLTAENHRLRAALEQLDGLDLVEVSDTVAQARDALAALTEQLDSTRTELAAEQAQLLDVRRKVAVQRRGLYDVEHPAETSTSLAARLSAVRTHVHEMVASGGAVGVARELRLGRLKKSVVAGQIVDQLSAIALAAYDAEAENAIRTVEPGRLDVARARLDRFAGMVAECGQIVDLHIDPEYHRLRTTELELAAQHAVVLAGQAETERAQARVLREATRAADGLRHERSLLEAEREYCSNALSKAHARGDTDGAERQVARLADLDQALADIDQRAADGRAGYVYVVSNIGSFGNGVVKIGLTRRPDPMSYIRELAEESVPFDFDVHALFFAADAVGVVDVLHQHLADRRVNLVNQRREFFRATPLEVFDALATHRIGVPEFRTRPGAVEYRTSLELAEAR